VNLYFTHLRHGLAGSHFLQAFWQFVHAFLTWLRFERTVWEVGKKGYMCTDVAEDCNGSLVGESGISSPPSALFSSEDDIMLSGEKNWT
jgi:hypothetical protein